MNVLNIALNEMRQQLSDKRTFIFQLAFPIILMLILGTALSGAFSSTIKIKDIDILYEIKADGEVKQAFHSFIKEAGKKDVHFVKAKAGMNGKAAVKQNKYDGFIRLSDQGIQLYENSSNAIKGGLIEGNLKIFADQYNLASAVSVADAGEIKNAFAPRENYVKETILNAIKQPGSMDYYAVAMATMTIFYSMMGACDLIRSERNGKTAIRLVAAPINKAEIFTGKLLGGIFVNVICVMLIVFISKFVLKAYWGNHLGIVFLVLLSEIILAIGIGLGVSYMITSEKAVNAILMVVVQVAAFFGGSYFEIDDPGEFGGIFTQLSPLHWANTSINKAIYANDFGPALHTSLLNLCIAVLFLTFSGVAMRRKEGL
ncbi:MAG: ABC transporter permease [Tuberibacillus sp.]